MTSKLSPPSVWINSKCCTFGASVFDSILSTSSRNSLREDISSTDDDSSANHYDRTLVSLNQGYDNGQLTVLSASSLLDGNGSKSVLRIPFERSRSYPPIGSHPCPTTVSETQAATQAKLLSQGSGPNVRRFVQLAVVGLVVTTERDINHSATLLYMRSFPHAWGYSGGSVDSTDDSLEAAIAREIWEETGLKVSGSSLSAMQALDASAGDGEKTTTSCSGWTIECIWESVFPTIPEPRITIKRHHLVVYLSIKLSEREMSQMSLKLCDEEVDAAVWLSPKKVNSILAKSLCRADSSVSEEEIWVDLLTSSNTQVAAKTGVKESLEHLSGIYPRFDDDDTSSQHPFGMAQGSLFALQEYFNRHHDE